MSHHVARSDLSTGSGLRRLTFVLAVIILFIALILFILTALAIHNTNNALNILEGTQSATQNPKWHELTVPLAIFGYFLVPVFIALAVTTLVQNYIGGRLTTDDDLEAIFEEYKAEHQQTPPPQPEPSGTTQALAPPSA